VLVVSSGPGRCGSVFVFQKALRHQNTVRSCWVTGRVADNPYTHLDDFPCTPCMCMYAGAMACTCQHQIGNPLHMLPQLCSVIGLPTCHTGNVAILLPLLQMLPMQVCDGCSGELGGVSFDRAWGR
jgi:hypothetical protein